MLRRNSVLQCVAGMVIGICSAPSSAAPLALVGVNLSGPELNVGAASNRINFDYTYPKLSELDDAARRGMTVIRLPVSWERLQPTLDTPLDPAEIARLRQTIDAARKRALTTIIDLHNYGGYRGAPVGSTRVPNRAFADLWRRMAHEFRDDTKVAFGLMNEPHDNEATVWATSAQTALNEIRSAGFRGLVLMSGTAWDGAHNFVSGGYGIPNAVALARLHDPAGNMAIEVHQYLDRDFSGTHADCPWADRTDELLGPVTRWLKQNHQRGFLGEFGVSIRPECLTGLGAMLDHLDTNRDVWLGWTYWAAGPWWSKDYMFSIEPSADGSQRLQTTILEKHLTPR